MKNSTVTAMVAERILKQLNEGVVPWTRPWCNVNTCARSHRSLTPYSLLNQWLLGRAGEYVTYKQAYQCGGHVKKGATSSIVVFWKVLDFHRESEYEDLDGRMCKEKTVKYVPMLRYYNVFHLDDCEGIEPNFKEELPAGAQRNETIEDVVDAYLDRAKLTARRDEKSNRAFYSVTFDYVSIPRMDQFSDTAEYYATLFHELVHSTGIPERLGRFERTRTAEDKFGSDSYSREELVAEIGACALLNYFGIESEFSFQNSASYIDHWSKAIRDDNSIIVTAAGRAEKAIHYILNDIAQSETTDAE